MTNGPTPFGPWSPDLDDAERMARFRSLASLAAVFVGSAHRLTRALRAAERDQGAADLALELFDALPALRRRHMLATYAAIHQPVSLATGASDEPARSP